jgi:hypothetical protein
LQPAMRNGRMLALLAVSALALAFTLVPSPNISAQALNKAEAIWQLGSQYYPSHTALLLEKPSNANLRSLLGPLHKHSYSKLRRHNDEGWIQLGDLNVKTTKLVGKQKKKSGHDLLWEYAASYYSNEAEARKAANDLKVATSPVSGLGDVGRFRQIIGGNEYYSLAVFSSKNIVVEQFCALFARDRKRYAAVLDVQCAKQRRRLAQVLKGAAVTPTQTPTPSTTPTSTLTPESTSVPISSPTPTFTPSPIPTATSTVPTSTSITATLTVTASVTPNPMPYGAYPTLLASTSPGAACSASVTYSTGRHPVSFDGSTRIADANGQVSWSWHEETVGSGGTAYVSCSFNGQTANTTAYFTVTH